MAGKRRKLAAPSAGHLVQAAHEPPPTPAAMPWGLAVCTPLVRFTSCWEESVWLVVSPASGIPADPVVVGVSLVTRYVTLLR